ncbi:hypothetical protein ACFVRU_19035, partial [Streptomyces sp. NPDC057927]
DRGRTVRTAAHPRRHLVIELLLPADVSSAATRATAIPRQFGRPPPAPPGQGCLPYDDSRRSAGLRPVSGSWAT